MTKESIWDMIVGSAIKHYAIGTKKSLSPSRSLCPSSLKSWKSGISPSELMCQRIVSQALTMGAKSLYSTESLPWAVTSSPFHLDEWKGCQWCKNYQKRKCLNFSIHLGTQWPQEITWMLKSFPKWACEFHLSSIERKVQRKWKWGIHILTSHGLSENSWNMSDIQDKVRQQRRSTKMWNMERKKSSTKWLEDHLGPWGHGCGFTLFK